MNSNLIIKDQSVAKVVTVLKYVTLTFNGDKQVIKRQIPGEITEKEKIDIKFVSQENVNNNYKILYNWLYNDIEAPLLVPNIDEDYYPNWCYMWVPVEAVLLYYNSSNYQTQEKDFIIRSTKPLYFKGETLDGNLVKNVSINRTIKTENENDFRVNLTFNIKDINVIPGSTKTFQVKLSIYKDHIFSKYLGYINISVKVTSTTGPGE